jgi:hypothetical protein
MSLPFTFHKIETDKGMKIELYDLYLYSILNYQKYKTKKEEISNI